MPPQTPVPPSESSLDAVRPASGAAYLVIREGGRWTDVYRLEPDRKVLIGRSSSNQIVIPDDRCSRHHAELAYSAGQWTVRDLGSRNGTQVDQKTIERPHLLAAGQTVSVAGCHMTFVRDIAHAFGSSLPFVSQEGDRDQDPQRTEEDIDPGLITHRQRKTELLSDGPSHSGRAGEIARIALQIAQSRTLAESATTVLDSVCERLGIQSGAILSAAVPGSTSTTHDAVPALQVLAAKHRSGRGYHRLPDLLASAVIHGGEAVLARNVKNDETLSRQDSRGQMSTQSTMAAPIRCGQQTLGMIHLYSGDGESDLQPEHLDFVLAVADVLGAVWNSLGRQADLTKRLERSRRRVEQLRAQLGDEHRILGESPAIERIREAVQRVGPTHATVLIRGESGTGKELVAAALHEASSRRDGPLVCMNCAALSPSLLESELFGHEKGAFTGATERKIGKFEAADGGTLMLDEIGEMIPDIQAKFLRVLEGHPFERVGGNQPIRVDVRVVAATNRDLEQAVRENRFRADLYYRLHVVELTLPPLRKRGEDVLLLAEAFLRRYAEQTGRRVSGFTTEARAKLMAHSWPGNVRELRNVIERAVVLGNQSEITPQDLWLSDLRLEVPDSPSPMHSNSNSKSNLSDDDLLSLTDLETQHIQRVLAATGGNKSKAAAILGIERSTLDRKLKRG